MAARNPTTWTQFIAETGLVPSRPILSVPIDQAYDDVEYILDAEQLAISDATARLRTNSAAFVEELRYPLIRIKDMCDEAVSVAAGNVITARWSARVYSVGATTNIDVQVVTDAATTTVTEAGRVTPIWTGWRSTDIQTNNLDENVAVSIRYSGVAGYVYLCGFCLVISIT